MPGILFLTVLFFLVILISGFRLHRNGRPYGTLLLTIHKLIPVGMLVYLGIMLNRQRPFSSLTILSGLLAALCFLLMIASGGWISAAKEPPASILIVHKVLPYFTLVTTALVLLLVFIY